MLSSRPRLAPRETSARPPQLLSVASSQSAAQGASRLAGLRLRATQIPAPPPPLPRLQPVPQPRPPLSSFRAGTSRGGHGRQREDGHGDHTAALPELLSPPLSLSRLHLLWQKKIWKQLLEDSSLCIWRVNSSTMKHFLRMLIQVCLYFYCKFLWRCMKFVMRKLTGRCELQRICYSTKPGASRTMKIEMSLRDSKSKLLQTSVSVHPDAIEKTIDDIMELKKINPDINPQLGISLQACLLQIVGYRNLIADVEKLRREPYDSDNPQHEEMLLKLWKFLKPNTPLESRISKQWCEIGFQGDDPKTDFRGMGLLGLYNLQYFAERDATVAQQVLSDSLHPKCSKFSRAEWEKRRMEKAIGYSFAIVGINITDLAYNLLVSGALKTHFYNIAPEAPTLSHFQQTFCYLMHEFHKFWIEEDPMDIMEFNRVREKFRKRIIKQLQNPDMALCPHFAASEGLINM